MSICRKALLIFGKKCNLNPWADSETKTGVLDLSHDRNEDVTIIMKKKKIRTARVWLWFGLGFLIGAISGRLPIAIAVALLFAFARYLGERLGTRPEPVVPPLSEEMSSHYANAGLSESETELFRETMDTAAAQIEAIETTVNAVPKLKSIALQTDLLPVMHAYFKAIVQAPKRLTDASDFIYAVLPNLQHLVERYQTISHHEVKTQETYDVLSQAADAITKQAAAISDSYQAFVSEDLEDLESEVNLSHKQIAAHSGMTHAVPAKETETINDARK